MPIMAGGILVRLDTCVWCPLVGGALRYSLHRAPFGHVHVHVFTSEINSLDRGHINKYQNFYWVFGIIIEIESSGKVEKIHVWWPK